MVTDGIGDLIAEEEQTFRTRLLPSTSCESASGMRPSRSEPQEALARTSWDLT